MKTKLSYCSLSLHAMIKSWHQVQHISSTGYTEYCIHCILHNPKIDSLPLPVSLSSLRQTMLYSILYIPTFMSYPMNTILPPIICPSQTSTSRLTASKYSSNLTQSWPPSAAPNLLHHSFQVYLYTYMVTASEYISKLTRWQPPRIWLNSHDYGHQVCMIMTFMCIYKLAQLQAASASSNSLNSWPPSLSLNSPNYGL